MPIGQPQPIQKLAVGQRLYNFGFTDSVLFTEAYMRPRYKGSKLIGAKINEYIDYSQLTADEYTARYNNDTSNLLGILPVVGKDLDTNFPEFIRTTKPMDGTLPSLAQFTLHGAPLLTANTNKASLKGNFAPFPIPGVAFITKYPIFSPTTPGFTRPLSNLNELYDQNGEVPSRFAFSNLGDAIGVWECQYMGGYRRDRSYGRNPVIEVKTSTIYEFDWGGSTYPEIEKGGSVHLKQIINVDSYAKGNPNVYIVNEATNDSFRVDRNASSNNPFNITITDNPTEETDFSINLKRSLYYNDVITLDSYAPPLEPVSGPEDIFGGLNALIASKPPFPTKNVIALEPGLGVPSYGSIYTQRGIFNDILVTSSITGEPVGVPYLPEYEAVQGSYEPVGSSSPRADFYMADFQNPTGPEVLASTLRNISGSYYYPSTVPNIQSAGTVQNTAGSSEGNGRIYLTSDTTKYLKITPNGVYTTGSYDVNKISVYTELSASLAIDNRHFVSFYGSLGTRVVGNLNQIGEPVEIKTVGLDAGDPVIYFKDTPPITGVIGESGGFGMLIWKAQQGAFAVMKPTNTIADFSYSNLREGGFYREHSTSIVKQHFKKIVETVGIKPLK